MTIKKMYIKGLSLLSLLFLILGSSCKEKQQATETSSTPEPEVALAKSLSPVYKEIANFMGLEVSDSTQIETILSFKVLMGMDSVVTSDATQNMTFYKAITKNGKATGLPIFEAKDTDLSLLLITGKGYVGPLWARVLVNTNTGKIVKVRFGHKMESEGYGNGIVSSAFGDQFGDIPISFEDNTFGLVQSGNTVIQGNAMVDGVTGATATSTGVVEMLNDGFKKYRTYLAN